MVSDFSNQNVYTTLSVQRSPSAVNAAVGDESRNAVAVAPLSTSSQNITDQNGRPAAEATSNMVRLSPMAAPVYAMVHKPRPTNAVDQSQASAPAAPPRHSRDYDTTLIDNDLYE